MNIELFIKIGALLISALGAIKLVGDWLKSHHGRLREEYEFARDFLQYVRENPEIHPFLKEKGYQAIAGNTSLKTGEIEYLINLQDAAQTLKNYAFSRKYLHHFSTASKANIDFQQKYQRSWVRFLRKVAYFTTYVGFVFCAFGPYLVMSDSLASKRQTLFDLAFTTLLFLPLAFLALREGFRITRAEALVNKIYTCQNIRK